MYGIVDCDNCYVSCERVFRPDLEGKAVVVLSNNDGCVVARSNEAKALGIKEGTPYFQLAQQFPDKKIAVFSSNYELYGDLTSRVLSIIAQEAPSYFRYSIDERFVYLDGMEHFNLQQWGENLHRRIKKSVGMPVSIGLAPTAAGIVALWVQAAADKGKTLTNADIKDIFSHSCDTDEFTKAAPHRFGAGKINAYKGLLYVLGLDTGIQGLSQKQPAGITFRVENGQLIAEGAEDGTAVTLYNLSGAIVRRATVLAGSVSLAGLQKGVYAVQLGKLGSTLIRL